MGVGGLMSAALGSTTRGVRVGGLMSTALGSTRTRHGGASCLGGASCVRGREPREIGPTAMGVELLAVQLKLDHPPQTLELDGHPAIGVELNGSQCGWSACWPATDARNRIGLLPYNRWSVSTRTTATTGRSTVPITHYPSPVTRYPLTITGGRVQ